MSQLSLYNISGRFFELDALAAEGILTEQQLEERQQELTTLLIQKSAGVVAYYRNMDGYIDAIEIEIERLQSMHDKAVKRRDSFKQYVKGHMDAMGITEITTTIGKLKISKNPISVDVLNLKQVPTEFRIVRTPPPVESVDKTAVKRHFEETGEIPPGLQINTSNTRLDIK